MAVAFCPECDRRIDVGLRPKKGQQVTCHNCGADLEVINLQPLELDWVYIEPERDWEEEELDWDYIESEEEWEEDWKEL